MKMESITWYDPKEQLPPFTEYKTYDSADGGEGDIDEFWNSDSLLVETNEGDIVMGYYERIKTPENEYDKAYDHNDFVIYEYNNTLEIDEVTAWAYLPKGSKGDSDERDNDAE